MATIKDIAQYSGVSTTTVSRIINNKADNISQEVKDRVMYYVKKYNYTPYGLPTKDSATKSFTIALLSRNVQSSFLIINGLIECLGDHGYSLMVFDSKESIKTERENLLKISSKSLDGLLWEPVSEQSSQNLDIINQLSVQKICINSGLDNIVTYSQNFDEMGYICTNKLLEKGHNSIACIIDQKSKRSEEFSHGYRRCLFDHDISFDQSFIINYDDDAVEKIINKNATGLISSHFSLAQNIYNDLTSLNLVVPDDISIISLRNKTKETQEISHISCVDIPDYDFGIFIADKMVALCEKNETDGTPFTHDVNIESDISIDEPDLLRKKKIIVVGQANIDTLLYVNKVPRPGDSEYTTACFTSPGGKGFNTAIAISNQKKNVYLISEIGKDHEGSIILQNLRKKNVNTSLIYTNPKYQTRRTFLTIDKNGESAAVITRESKGSLSEEDIERMSKRFENTGVCVAQSGLSLNIALKAFEIAKKKGSITIFKPFPVYKMNTDEYRNIDIIIPNRKEALELSGSENIDDAISYFLSKGVANVILTLDKEGVVFATKNQKTTYPAPKTNAVDTTGASDAFIATFAVKLLEGYDIDYAINAALISVGFFISGFGITDSFVSKETLDRLIKLG